MRVRRREELKRDLWRKDLLREWIRQERWDAIVKKTDSYTVDLAKVQRYHRTHMELTLPQFQRPLIRRPMIKSTAWSLDWEG